MKKLKTDDDFYEAGYLRGDEFALMLESMADDMRNRKGWIKASIQMTFKEEIQPTHKIIATRDGLEGVGNDV